MVYFSCTYWEIDSWDDTDSVDFVLDSKTFSGWKQSVFTWSGQTDICGIDYTDLPGSRIFARAKHSATSIRLNFTMRNNEPSDNEAAGFRDIRMLFATATSSLAMSETMCALALTPLFTQQCTCPEGKYFDTTSGCHVCNSLCVSCFGPSAAECYQCASGAGFDGTACVQCASSCGVCHGSQADQCDECVANYIFYNNKYCVPVTQINLPCTSSSDICGKVSSTGPCNPPQFLYWDSSCSDSCSFPLKTIDISLPYMGCSYICPIDQYLYWDQTCGSDCNFPLVKNIIKSRNLCIYPCSINQYLNWNGLCLSSCIYPKKTRVEGGRNFCDLPCLISDYYYENDACLSFCSDPMKVVTIDSAKICRKPCLDPAPYYCPDDQNCMPVCLTPSKAFERGFYTTCELQISSEDKKAVQGLSSMSNNAGNASSITTMATSVLSASDPGGISAGMLSKMLQYTKFLTVVHNARLELMLKQSKLTTGFLMFAPKISESTKGKFTNKVLPAEFMKYKVHSSFIVNFWDGFMSLAICAGVLFFLFVFDLATKPKESESRFHIFINKVRLGVQNFLLMQFYNCYGDIVLFSIIDMSTVKFGAPPAALSFNMGLLFTFTGIIILVLHVLLLRKYQRVRVQPTSDEPHEEDINKFSQYHEGVQVLFFSFKDASIITQGFFLFLTLRNVSYSMIVTLLYDYTLVQLILMTSLSLAMIGYLIFARPFKKLVNLFQQIFGEAILLIVNSSLLGIFIISKKAPESSSLQEKLNEVIIVSNMAVGFIAPVFLVIKIALIVIEVCKTRREWKRQQRVVESLEDQVRRRKREKKQEVIEQMKDENSPLPVHSILEAPCSLLDDSGQLKIEQKFHDNLSEVENLRLSHHHGPNFQAQMSIHPNESSSINKILLQQSSVNPDEGSEIRKEGRVQETSMQEIQQDCDMSSANLRLDVIDLEVMNSSLEIRKTRWLKQRQQAHRTKQD